MAKMVANKYYTKGGVDKVNSYFINISKDLAEQSGLIGKDLKISIKNGKIIVESLDEKEKMANTLV